ncbi:unnamed protein product [Fusarium graminearum]|nr:unnamed protein product [Fusarium graminearum]
MLLSCQPDIDVSAIRDDLKYRKVGWPFIDKTDNNLADIWVQKSSFRDTPFIKSRQCNPETCHKYLNTGVGNVFIYYGHMIIIISYYTAREFNNYAFYMSAMFL